jgi:hypothetical protein
MYVHSDWRLAHYVKVVLDEVFGKDNFLDNVIWSYQTRHSLDRFGNRKHDDLLLYKKSERWTFNWRDEEVIQKLSPVTISKYRNRDEKGFYRLNGRFLKGSPIKGAKDVDPKWEKNNPELVVRDYLRPGIPPNDSFFVPIENQSSADRTGLAMMSSASEELFLRTRSNSNAQPAPDPSCGTSRECQLAGGCPSCQPAGPTLAIELQRLQSGLKYSHDHY